MGIRWHSDAPEDLRAAIDFTAETTGFLPRLIEKDYFCSVVLEVLGRADAGLVFKGGTCLAKVHAGFFRMSEDLDFTIPIEATASRAHRRRAVAPAKKILATLAKEVFGLEGAALLEGHNDSSQYNATLTYRSILTGNPESIAVEIGLREPNLTAVQRLPVHTSLLHWARGEVLVEPFAAPCLSYPEAMAEKLRAALSRREVAIRDFFDIDYAMRSGALDPTAPALLELVRRKLAVPGTAIVDLSETRVNDLRRQRAARLRPVLREREYAAFDLDRAIEAVRAVAHEVAGGR